MLSYFVFLFGSSPLKIKFLNDVSRINVNVQIRCEYYPHNISDGRPFQKYYNISRNKAEYISFANNKMVLNWPIGEYLVENYGTKFTLYINYRPIQNNSYFSIKNNRIFVMKKKDLRFSAKKITFPKRKRIKIIVAQKSFTGTDLKRSLIIIVLFLLLFLFGIFQILFTVLKK